MVKSRQKIDGESEIFGFRGGKNEKLFVPLHPNVELSHGAAEDQSDMMMTTREDERTKRNTTLRGVVTLSYNIKEE